MNDETVEIIVDEKQVKPQTITCQTDNCNQVFTGLDVFQEHIKKAHSQLLGGRPCEYCKNKEKIDAKVKDYIARATGEKPQMVYLGEICIMLGIHKETLQDWAHKKNKEGELEHPTFSDLVKNAELIQETRLQQRVLGRYNPTGAIFLLKTKHGYMETDKRVLAGDSNAPVEIIITEEEDRKKDGE